MMLAKWVRQGNTAQSPSSFILPLELEDSRPVQVQRKVLRYGAVLLVVAALWAGLTPIREMAIAPGVIVPKGEVRAVQHLEGGIVEEILHRPGEEVKAGEPLLRLADDQAAGDLGQLQVRLAGLEQQQAQLSQLIENRDGTVPSDLALKTDLGSTERAVLETRLREKEEERSALRSRIAQREAALAKLTGEAEVIERLVQMRTKIKGEKEALLAKGLATRRSLYEDTAALEQARIQLLTVNGQLAATREELAEARTMLDSSDATALRAWSEELSKVTAEAREVREAIAKQQDRVDRLVVRAPIDGVIQALAVRSPGEVIRPGDTFARIVPTGVPLQAEVQIRPDDIGSVKVGDPAELRVTAFDSGLYGKLTGRIESISPSSFQRENGDYYYTALVELPGRTLQGKREIGPGMVVSAEIITGAKSFLRYILKPIYKVLDPAFSER